MKIKKLVAGMITTVMVIPMFVTNILADETGIAIDEAHFPDSSFRAIVTDNYDKDENGFLSDTEIQAATILYIPHEDEISSLVGIEYLSELRQLTMYSTKNIETVDLTRNYNLEKIDATNSNLSSLYLGNNDKLEHVEVYDTKLSRLDISGCPNIKFLDISVNTSDTFDYINICNNPYLLDCYELGTDQTSSLRYVELSYKYDGTNRSFLSYDVHTGDQNGTTVINEVPEGAIPIDINTFPNPYFRDYVLTNFDNGDGYLTSEEIAAVESISYSSSRCSSLEGIEYFTGLRELTISEMPELIVFDTHNLTNLQSLSISNTGLRNIIFETSENLSHVELNGNPFTRLDVSALPALIYLDVSNSDIDELNVSNNQNINDLCVTVTATVSGGVVTYSSRGIVLKYDEGVSLVYTEPVVPTEVPTVTPTVRPTTSPTNRPTVAPTTVPTTEPVSESGVAGFVERLYTIALDRASDPNGKADWVNRVYTAGATGADVAQGFLFSPEFLGKDMSNEDFLGVLYRVFFDRVGDQGGIDYWLENMANGMDKQIVIWGFINSTEWANVCLRFGIASGGNGVPNITIEPSPEIIEFATRLYTTCLGRNADQNGLMDWATQLANRQISGSQAAAGFFTSSEFVNANYENAEYINRLYRTFMGREADQGGFDYWMGQFEQGATREDVFNGFAGSAEWAGICSSYGILK